MHALIDTWRRRIQVTRALGVALLSVAVLVIGWGAGLEVLVRVKATYAAMVPTTAACFCLIAIAVIQAHMTAANRVWRVRIPLLLVVILVGLNMVIVTENGSGLDALLFGKLSPGDGMARGTGVGLLAVAYCVECLPHKRAAKSDMSGVVALMGLVMAFAIILGHSFDAVSGSMVPWFEQTSVLTASLFLALFTGLAIPDASVFALDPKPERNQNRF